jgi:hypothetical protein
MMLANRPKELVELEAIAAKLLEAACKLPPGETRQGVLKEIGRLRARIGRLPARNGNGHGPSGGQERIPDR